MSRIALYECDVCGDRFGAKNDVLHFEVRRHRGGSPFEITTETLTICYRDLSDFDDDIPTRIDYVAVDRGEILGGVFPVGYGDEKRAPYTERDNSRLAAFDSFFEYVENEVLGH